MKIENILLKYREIKVQMGEMGNSSSDKLLTARRPLPKKVVSFSGKGGMLFGKR